MGKCVENVYHNQCFEMNVCEIKYSHALLNALNIHGKCTGVKMHYTTWL